MKFLKINRVVVESRRFVNAHAPTLLTGVGVAGVAATAYLAARGAIQATEKIAEQETPSDELTLVEQVKLTWLCYAPAVGAGSATIAAIIFANRINAKRAAALASALMLADKAHDEYRDKVEELMGKNKEQKVRDGVAQDRMNKQPASNSTVYIANDGGEHLCYEQYMGHYVKSSMEDLKSLRNEINDTMLRADYVSLSDWYSQLGIPSTPASDVLGWRADGGLIELDISTTLSDDGTPCLAFDFRPSPRPGYDLAH